MLETRLDHTTQDSLRTGKLKSAAAGTIPRWDSVPYNLFYSSSVEGNLRELLGAQHYSYRFAEAKFISTISQNEQAIRKLAMPEYYATVDAFPPNMLDRTLPNVHLIYRSTEQIRLLKFAWNICCFAWEFDVLKDDTQISEHPFLNQKRMLSLCDELWVPCSYTQKVLKQHGVENAYLIPAPISIPDEAKRPLFDALIDLGHVTVAPLYHNFLLPKIENQALCEERSGTIVEYLTRHQRNNENVKIYISIFNPEDDRKNLDAILRAFHYFSLERPECILLIKLLTSSSRYSLFESLSGVIPHKLASGTAFASNNVIFFNDYLSDDEMVSLFGMADFYLCAPICEGQNLPLLEAMAHGVVPLSNANTAMADYIMAENAVIIGTTRVANENPHLAGTIARKPFHVHLSRVEDIYNALQRSVLLSPPEYTAMAERARETVREKYSAEVVWSRMMERFTAIRPMVIQRQNALMQHS